MEAGRRVTYKSAARSSPSKLEKHFAGELLKDGVSRRSG